MGIVENALYRFVFAKSQHSECRLEAWRLRLFSGFSEIDFIIYLLLTFYMTERYIRIDTQ